MFDNQGGFPSPARWVQGKQEWRFPCQLKQAVPTPRLSMAQIDLSSESLKLALKEALVEALQEERELFREILAEALEEFALAEAIREGLNTRSATRDEVVRILNGKA